ncbi:UNVERIFIED_CONTAM: hypothetical protein FKN15_072790 [Acipenser sinensis]
MQFIISSPESCKGMEKFKESKRGEGVMLPPTVPASDRGPPGGTTPAGTVL